MWKDKFIGIMLIVISILLLLNLVNQNLFVSWNASAEETNRFQRIPNSNPQSIGFRGNGIGMTCSSDGRYVYAAASRAIFRSTNYGNPGSWEQVLSE